MIWFSITVGRLKLTVHLHVIKSLFLIGAIVGISHVTGITWWLVTTGLLTIIFVYHVVVEFINDDK